MRRLIGVTIVAASIALGGAALLAKDAMAMQNDCSLCSEEAGCYCVWGGYENGWLRCIYHCGGT